MEWFVTKYNINTPNGPVTILVFLDVWESSYLANKRWYTKGSPKKMRLEDF